jgi:2-C-methyl-D-erythritol 4-phosphate cytidylyltransferase
VGLDPAAKTADAIVVAAGASIRMGGVDKLATPIGGRPLLAWTLDALARAPVVTRLIVVTSADRVEAIRGAPWLPPKVVSVVLGADRRQGSVAAGLAELDRLDGGRASDDDARVVLVHDGARPVVSPELIAGVASAAAVHGAAIPVVPIGETVKRIASGWVEATVDRSGLATAQTPQGIDDRSSARRSNASRRTARTCSRTKPRSSRPVAFPSMSLTANRQHQGDAACGSRSRRGRLQGSGGRTRTGIGHDGHPFGPGTPLVLGGVRIDGAPRLHGHSDGRRRAPRRVRRAARCSGSR